MNQTISTDPNDDLSSNILTLNACGLRCPEPVMMLHTFIRQISAGEVFRVVTTDPSTERDIPRFCMFLGHTLLKFNSYSENDIQYWTYWIKRKALAASLTDSKNNDSSVTGVSSFD